VAIEFIVQHFTWSLRSLFPLAHLLTLQLLFRYLLFGRLVILNLRDNLLLLTENHFQVARGAHVRIDPTMGAVGSSAHVWCTVNLIVRT